MNIPKKFYLYGKKCHLVGVLNDNGTQIATFKTWRKHKQRWDYQSEIVEIVQALMVKHK